MPSLKIGIHLGSLRMPLKKSLQLANQLGANGVEIDARTELRPSELSQTAIRQMRKLLEDLNLRVCAVRFYTRRGYNVPDDLDRRVQATRDALQMAYRLGASAVVNYIGRIPAQTPIESAGPKSNGDWDLLVQTLTDLGAFGQKVGAQLAARTGAESGADLARLIEALSPGALGVDLDPGGLIVNNFSPRDAVSALGENILHVHARDGVRDLAQGRGIETQLGRGSADFPELLAMLEETGYRGYFTIEREQTADPVGEIGQAVQYLRSL